MTEMALIFCRYPRNIVTQIFQSKYSMNCFKEKLERQERKYTVAQKVTVATA
jgi:transposase-like protein